MQAAQDQESLPPERSVLQPPPTTRPLSKDAKAADAPSERKTELAAVEASATVPAPTSPHSSASPDDHSPSPAALQLLKELKAKIGAVAHSQGPMIDVRATKEGLLISLTDQLNFSMFAIGSAEPQPQLVRVMDVIAQSLFTRAGRIVLRGHTDGRPYRSPQYDNWRLSEARAQMAYYMLTRANLGEKRIERVEGYADHHLRNSADPYAAENRRICAGGALKDASLDSHEQARARFYQTAASLTLEDDATVARDLQAIPKAGLDQKDLDLLAAVRRVAAAVYAEPPPAAMSRPLAKEEGGQDSGSARDCPSGSRSSTRGRRRERGRHS